MPEPAADPAGEHTGHRGDTARPAGTGRPGDAARAADAARPDDTGGPGDPAVPEDPDALAAGPGRVLVALYGFFALAAGARAGVQLATRFAEAPLAYVLSAVAAAVYVVATIGLARGGRAGLRTAAVACSVELAGVLVVGTLSLVDRAAFPDATVWSGYGRGYGFVPLALPVLGLLWLRHKAQLAAEEGEDGGAG